MPFKTRARTADEGEQFDWHDTTTADWFKGKATCSSRCRARSPACSNYSFEVQKAYADFKAAGIDDVYCLGVNDAFVMRQWGLAQGLPERASARSASRT